jgi:hypothetical protein
VHKAFPSVYYQTIFYSVPVTPGDGEAWRGADVRMNAMRIILSVSFLDEGKKPFQRILW